MPYQPEFAGEQISDFTYVETIGDPDAADQKVLVVPGFFNEEVGSITKRVETAVSDHWPNTVAMVVHCDDPKMVRSKDGIQSSWEDLTVVEDHFQALAPRARSRELDISLGAGKRLMNPADQDRPKAAFSMVTDPLTYWQISRQQLVGKFIEESDGHRSNIEALEAIRDAYSKLSEKVFDLVLIEDRSFYSELDLLQGAEKLLDKGAIGVLEKISGMHAFLQNRTAKRLSQFWQSCEDSLSV